MLNTEHFIEKMNQWRFCLGVNLLLAIGVFFCALLGRSLGIQGPALAISVVWPATGLSLAILLLFGYRAAAGVFIGNFAYNFLFLTLYPPSIHLSPFYAFIAALFISAGSFAQALVSTFIMRTYSTPLFFRTVQDVFIFLLPASALSCLIGSIIGIVTLAMTGGVDASLFLPVSLIFWLGDTVGIYVITPLIVVWALQRQTIKYSEHIFSIFCMLFLFVFFAFIVYLVDRPLPHLFVPISIWAAYLFRMHGASLAIFLMTAGSVAFAATHGYEGTSLILLFTFIGVTIAASLIIAAVVNERTQAWALLDSRNLYLEKEVDVKVEILKQFKSEAFQKQKHASQDSALKLLALKIQAPLSEIDRLTKNAQHALDEMQGVITEKKEWTPEIEEAFLEKLHQIKQDLSSTLESQKMIVRDIENLG